MFFHWSCEKCGVFGGVDFDTDHPPDEIVEAAQESHDDSGECEGSVSVREITVTAAR